MRHEENCQIDLQDTVQALKIKSQSDTMGKIMQFVTQNQTEDIPAVWPWPRPLLSDIITLSFHGHNNPHLLELCYFSWAKIYKKPAEQLVQGFAPLYSPHSLERGCSLSNSLACTIQLSLQKILPYNELSRPELFPDWAKVKHCPKPCIESEGGPGS